MEASTERGRIRQCKVKCGARCHAVSTASPWVPPGGRCPLGRGAPWGEVPPGGRCVQCVVVHSDGAAEGRLEDHLRRVEQANCSDWQVGDVAVGRSESAGEESARRRAGGGEREVRRSGEREEQSARNRAGGAEREEWSVRRRASGGEREEESGWRVGE